MKSTVKVRKMGESKSGNGIYQVTQLLNEELKALGVRRVNWHPFI